jgi:S1-C subfamily serine protease
MARVLLTLLLFIVSFSNVFAVSPWAPVVDKIRESVVFLEALDAGDTPTGFCTGFVIDTKKAYVLTAAHCDGPKVLVNGTTSYRVFKDARKDLMVLRASVANDLPAIALADKDPSIGDQVGSYGFGMAMEKPIFRMAHVSVKDLQIEELSGPFLMVDAGFIGGQSGGPVFNEMGQLVAIVQRGNLGLGLGIGAEVIKDRVGRYFQKD